MTIETEIGSNGTGFQVRAYWGFAFRQESFATEAEALANAPAVAARLEARIRAAQA